MMMDLVVGSNGRGGRCRMFIFFQSIPITTVARAYIQSICSTGSQLSWILTMLLLLAIS